MSNQQMTGRQRWINPSRDKEKAEAEFEEMRAGVQLALWWITNDRRAPHRRLVVQRLEELLGEEFYG